MRASGSGGARLPVGVIRDRAFSFYYPENLEALEAAGAQLVILNALEDVGLATVDAPGEGENPPVAAIYAGGGFPEVMAAELEANDSFRADLRRAVARGLPVYAECGGLLYLVRQVRWGNRSFAMAGVLPLELEMRERPQGHGYVEAEVVGENPYFVPGQVIRGHEFHHSAPVLGGEGHIPGGEFVFRLKRGTGFGQGRDGLRWGSVFAAYTHIHVLGCPGWASALVAQARAYACERGERNTTWE
ncbi:MAG TPA: hypothetical protein GX513_04055 [Firmicutes bacterium]|nr:hypothetical protein [Bacillota bacterium]